MHEGVRTADARESVFSARETPLTGKSGAMHRLHRFRRLSGALALVCYIACVFLANLTLSLVGLIRLDRMQAALDGRKVEG
jgi:hypothetical protein